MVVKISGVVFAVSGIRPPGRRVLRVKVRQIITSFGSGAGTKGRVGVVAIAWFEGGKRERRRHHVSLKGLTGGHVEKGIGGNLCKRIEEEDNRENRTFQQWQCTMKQQQLQTSTRRDEDDDDDDS